MPEPNERYPLQPDYVGPDTGLFLCCHHDRLYEYVWSARERAAYIRQEKLHSEQAARAAHFCLLNATDVPEIPAPVWAEGVRLWAESVRLWTEAEGVRLWAESGRLWIGGRRLLEPYHSVIESAARRLIPDCRWNGKQIVFEEQRDA